MNTAGTHNQSLYHAVVLAGHEIEDITDVWFDDETIPDASIDWSGDGSVDSGWLAGDTGLATTTYLDKFLGGSGQVASPDLISAFAEINSAHIGAGLAWFLSRTDFFEGQTDVWSGGAPRNYRALVTGKKVYNPSSDGTQSFGTGPHRLVTPSTWEYSNDPALCWADYMIDSDLGFGEDSSRINYGYVASANLVNRVVAFTPVGTDFRFTCNGTLSTGNTHEQNLNSILASANMTMALIQGVWKLRPWAFETPTLAFTDDDLRGDIQIRLSTPEHLRYNTVRATFIDRDRRYQAHRAPQVTAAEYVARDNAEVLFKDVQQPMTTDIFESQRLSTGILEQSDLQQVVIYPSNYKTLPVEIGGTIKLSNTKMEWDEETFRVTNYKLNDMKGIDLVLQEDNSAAYVPVGTLEYSVANDGNYSTADPGVPAPNSLWTLSRPDGNLIQVNLPPARLFETVRIYTAVTSNAFANAAEISDSDASSFLHQYQRPRKYWYWARAVNYAGEFSDVIPTSGSSNISALPALQGGMIDYTFDLSEDIDDFYEELGQTVTISKSGGENGEHAALMNALHFNSDAGLRTNQFFPILSDTVHMRTRYRVETWSGVGAGSQYLVLQVRGYHPTPVSSTFDKFQQTNPSTYTSGAVKTINFLSNSINQTGSWANINVNLDIANIINGGETMVNFAMLWTTSDTVTVNATTRALHNTFVHQFK